MKSRKLVAFAGLLFIAVCLFLLASVQVGAYSFIVILESASSEKPNFNGAIVILMAFSSLIAVQQFISALFEKAVEPEQEAEKERRIQEAIARFKPEKQQGFDGEIQHFPKIGLRLMGYYPALFLLTFGILSLLPNPYAERQMLERNNDYTKLIELYPDNPVYYLRRGRMQNPLAQQLADLDKAIQLKPDYAEAYEARAYVRSNAAHDGSIPQSENAKELYRLALADVDEAVRLDPNLYSAWRIRSIIHYDGFKDYDAAIADCNEMIRIQPKAPEGYAERARYHINHGDHDAAIADYTKAIEVTPPNVRRYYALIYADRGDQYAKKGDWQKASDDYAAAIQSEKELGKNGTYFERKYQRLMDEKRKAGK